MNASEAIPKASAPGARREKSRARAVSRPLNALKRAKRLAARFVRHFTDASYDLFRYLRYSNSLSPSSNDSVKLEALLFFNYHKIEKALALPTIKPVFGLEYVTTTLDLADKWAARTGDLDAVCFRGAYAALMGYREHVARSLPQVRPALWERLNQFLEKYAARDISPQYGGAMAIAAREVEPSLRSMSFEHLVTSRHTVRNFSERRIPDEIILDAIKLAQRTPSVCNRQCWRVHVFTTSYDVARVLQHQNGNEGFGHLAERVLLLTAELRSFLSSGERHQAEMDSGMFAMTLVLALEAQGVASCCLNLCLSAQDENRFRNTCKIPRSEMPIMLIAIGYPAEEVRVAVSARKPITSVVQFRDLLQESARFGGSLSRKPEVGAHTERRTLVLAGNGSYSNRGCEAILRGTIELLNQEIGPARFISNYFPSKGSRDAQFETDPSILHRPFPILARYSLPWIEEQFTRKVFHQPHNARRVSRVFSASLADADAVLMLGGDNFSLDYAGVDVHFKLCQWAVARDLPVIIWGASVGPFSKRPAFEQWAAKQLRQVTLICARETATLEYLRSIGVSKNVVLTADPAFHLTPACCPLPAEIDEVLDSGCIGLNLSPILRTYVKIPGSESSLAAWTQIAADIVGALARDLPLPVLLIPHVISESGDINRDDYAFMSRVAAQIGQPTRVFILPPTYNANQSKWIISRVRAFAGARTHSTLAAISSCVPTICIGYSMKAEGIARDVYGHPGWLLSGQDLVKDCGVLRDRYMPLLAEEATIRAQLEQVNHVMRERARLAARQVGAIIASRSR